MPKQNQHQTLAKQFFTESLALQPEGKSGQYTIIDFIDEANDLIEQYRPDDITKHDSNSIEEDIHARAYFASLNILPLFSLIDDTRDGDYWNDTHSKDLHQTPKMLQTIFETLEAIKEHAHTEFKDGNYESDANVKAAERLLEFKDSVEYLSEQLNVKLNGHEQLPLLKDFLDQSMGVYYEPGEQAVKVNDPFGDLKIYKSHTHDGVERNMVSVADVLEKAQKLFEQANKLEDPNTSMQYILSSTPEFVKLANQLVAFHQEPSETETLNKDTVQEVPGALKRTFNMLAAIEYATSNSSNYETKKIAADAGEILQFREQFKVLTDRFSDRLAKAAGKQTGKH